MPRASSSLPPGVHPETPLPHQRSVWDFPRPPALHRVQRHVRVTFAGEVLIDTHSAWEVLETSHPPVYFVDRAAVRPGVLQPVPGTTWCEWKGTARYFDVVVADAIAPRAAFAYDRPTAGFAPLAGHVALYAGPMDRCEVDGQLVQPQPGGFYAGWITPDVVGPFKGGPGTRGW